jgi:F-type H+-transporting ATPase subunit delta
MRINKRAKDEAKRLFQLSHVDGLLDETRIRRAAADVAAAGHRDRLAILTHLLRLVKGYTAEHTAQVESAITLPADVQADLEATLARRYGQGLETRFTVRPPLIGGIRIQVGSDVYDGTVQAGLAALEKCF